MPYCVLHSRSMEATACGAASNTQAEHLQGDRGSMMEGDYTHSVVAHYMQNITTATTEQARA